MRKHCSSSFRRTVSDPQTRICRNTGWTGKGLPAFNSLIVVILLLGSCAPVVKPPQRSALEKGAEGTKEPVLPIPAPCSREEAEQWSETAATEVGSALKAANCYAFLATTGENKALRLADARTGRHLAESAVQRYSESGLAHYLYAYLTGLEAENDPLRGLELVPVIESEARKAAELSPSIDHAGPFRMLGELYLRTPGMPISIGDVEEAIISFRQALTIAPGFAENRLGLAEALLKAEEATEACSQLHVLLTGMPPAGESGAIWQKSLDLLKRVCTAKCD